MGQLHDCSPLVLLPDGLLWNHGNTARRGLSGEHGRWGSVGSDLVGDVDKEVLSR